MPNTVLGKVSVTPKGAWSGSSSYEKLDIVSNGGNSYIALQNVPSGTALSNSSYWLMIAQKGDKGDKGDTGATGATGATGNGISSVEVEETSVVGNVHTYTLTISMTDGTSEVFTYEVTDGAVTSVNGRTGDVTGLAEDDGYYENMTVGSADQLISSVNIEDKVPYVFRTSGGANDIGDREVDEIVGGTVAWNQLRADTDATLTRDGITTAYDSSTHKISITNDSRTTNFSQGSDQITLVNAVTVGHKYLVDSDKNESGVGIVVLNVNSQVLTFVPVNSIFTFSNTATRMALRVRKDYDFVTAHPVNDVFSFYLNIYDLTQMFGSTIADYIYSLEQANAGAGVAWFKSLFPNPYYPYNAGELISVSGLSAHKMTGFNQWDEEWEVGDLSSTTGQPISASDRIRAKNYIPVVPNTTYYLKCPNYARIITYDSEYKMITYWSTGINNTTFTTDSDACFMKFYVFPTYGTVYKNDICINLHWDGERDGEYEPYESHSYALDSDVILRGVPKLDADNKLYFDGDSYASDGTVTRKYGFHEFTGAETLGWYASGSSVKPCLQSLDTPTGGLLIANRARMAKDFTESVSTGNSENFLRCANNGIVINLAGFDRDNYESIDAQVTAVKTQLATWYASGNPLTVVYEIATPTTESADPYTTIQQVSNWGTEEYVIAEQNGVALPVGHLTRYTQDLKAKLEMAPQSPSAGNGDYVVRQTNGINEYVKLVIPTELPTAPSSDGNYTLKCRVSGGTATYSWVSE